MSILISIIIPAFNINRYLAACLDSIVKEKPVNIEVIIINDGSTDLSGDIADYYAKQYDYIEVIHQSNQGVSAARNTGLLYAIGEYVWFVDGDDIIDNGAIVYLKNIIGRNIFDILIFDYENFIGNINLKNEKSNVIQNVILSINFMEYFSELLENGVYLYAPWNKIVKRQLLVDSNLQFDSRFIYSEDYLWNYQVSKEIHTIAYVNYTLYYYRKNRKNSATTLISPEHLESALQILELSIKDMIEYSDNAIFLKNYLLYSSQTFFYILPEYFKSGMLNKKNDKRFYKIYRVYKIHEVNLSIYNKGAIFFVKLNRLLPWHLAIRTYCLLVNIRRCIQLNIRLKK